MLGPENHCFSIKILNTVSIKYKAFNVEEIMFEKLKDINFTQLLVEIKKSIQLFVIKPFIGLVFGEKKIQNLDDLQDYIQRKSAFITQETLFGYLKTRIGINYVKMYDNEDFIKSINIAKWNIYMTAIQDLTFFSFSYLYVKDEFLNNQLAKDVYEKILDQELKNEEYPLPEDIYTKAKNQFEERFNTLSWTSFYKDNPFKTSSEALFFWAPVAPELKNLDKQIVINSMQLKWDNVVKEFFNIIHFGK
jgi:hypothetical protein